MPATLPLLSMDAFKRHVATSPVRQAHADMIARLQLTPPNYIAVKADPYDLEERVEHISEIIGLVRDYLIAVTSDTAENMVGAHRAELANFIDIHLCDLSGDVGGTILKVAGEMREDGE